MSSIETALRQRYGAADQPGAIIWNGTLELLLSHRSVRAYRDEPLPTGTLETMIAAAQSPASSSNLQAWSVVAVEEQARKERLAELAGGQGFIRRAPLFLLWIADLSRLARIAAQRGLDHEGLDYTELLVVGIIDATLAAQNAVIAAESLGLGTVYVGAIRNHPLEVAAELHLPTRAVAVFGLCVGWPDPDKPTAVKPRLPQAAVLHRETYSSANEAAAVAQYNTAMRNFYAEQQMRVEGDWTDHSTKRVAGPQNLSGRDKLRDALQQLGFGMR
ncbi:NADPH-dependent oxidoreductase [Candidatus Viridilinea mediisalina]|uniref:NADPH-dependent oxidoreductase n=1 Tax=Candidatus Viridilinea mediisalina TaxID=2024553 RepID=A0A2A6RHI2_9CHLR|nr:NADPH-dependent oxidoreductase [Candidatus Viridilinea mediisalina]PDW02472.1 NADPH-dependent oxidoreductase [Candidatus Viridilinea mediisalina]